MSVIDKEISINNNNNNNNNIAAGLLFYTIAVIKEFYYLIRIKEYCVSIAASYI